MLSRATFRRHPDLLLTQAQQDFLESCGLPAAWAGQAQWRVLDIGFGQGLHFLLIWQAWKADPQRPRLLHFVSTEGAPSAIAELLRAATEYPELLPLAVQLCEQWHGLLPGVHRLAFEDGQVLLTLGIGDTQGLLKESSFEADSVYLGSLSPQGNPGIWDQHTLKALARCCRRGTRLASRSVAPSLIDGLSQCGFEVVKTLGSTPQFDHLQACFKPHWEPKKAAEPNKPKLHLPKRCVVIGAGLAGAACAASLARRGWLVTLLDAHGAAAGGASALPVGMLAPHTSPDDSQLSRLSRNGLRATWQFVKTHLRVNVDWQANGVLQRRFYGSGGLPRHWPESGEHWSRLAGPDDICAIQTAAGAAQHAANNTEEPALWHAAGGWIKPQRLVQALLATPGITAQYGVKVASLRRTSVAGTACIWQVVATNGGCLADAELVVLAAGVESADLTPQESLWPARLALQPIRGQVAGGAVTDATAMPPFPVNGHGSFIPAYMGEDGTTHWLMGATFQRDCNDSKTQGTDQQHILERLQRLLPGTAETLKTTFDDGHAQAWAGVRCVSADRLPLVGPLDDAALPGVYVCTALGSRGLSFAVLCGELLAAWLHAEPLPIEKRLAHSLLASRYRFSE